MIYANDIQNLDNAIDMLANGGRSLESKVARCSNHLYGEKGVAFLNAFDEAESIKHLMRYCLVFSFDTLLRKEGFKTITDFKRLMENVKHMKLGEAKAQDNA